MNDPLAQGANATSASCDAPLPTIPPDAPPSAVTKPAALETPPPGYEILCEVGGGGMGVVYRARDLSLGRPVALKYLRECYAQSATVVARFLYEAHVTAWLQHPGIPPIHAVGTLADGRPFLAMKLIRGRTLEALILEQGPGAGRWLAVFEAICQAVAYAHSEGVIHRDLKPGNVMVGALGEVQVVDWGLAKSLRGQAEQAEEGDPFETAPDADPLRAPAGTQTRAGAVMGTPAYMPPEQAIGAVDQLDRRSDVFGLGAILCALLTGRPPFVGTDAESTRQLAARARLDDAFARLDGCGAEPDLVALAKRCLAAEQGDRPADAEALAAEVAALRHSAEDRARLAELGRAGAVIQAAEQRKRRRLTLAAAGFVVAALLAGVVGTTVGMFQALKAHGEADKKRGEAESDRDLARRRYRLALDAFDHMVFAVQKKLEARSGTQELRKELLGNARKGLKILLEEAENLGTPDSTLVWAHFRMGDVEKALGDAPAALAEYQAGHELAKALAAAAPESVIARRDLSHSFERLGDAAFDLGETAKALDYYAKSLVDRQRQADDDPGDFTAQRDLALSFERMGGVARRLGDTKGTLRHFRKALEIYQRLADAGTDTAAQHTLGIQLRKLGNVALHAGDPKNALDYQTRALTVFQRLADADGKNDEVLFDLSVCHVEMGDVRLAMDQTEEALGHFTKALAICQRLTAADQRNIPATHELSIVYGRLARVALHQGRQKEALDHYAKDVEILRRVADADPGDVEVKYNLGAGLLKLGEVTQQVGRPKEAFDLFAKSRTIFQQLADADPGNAAASRGLGHSFEKLGDVALRMNDPKGAEDFYTKSLATFRRVADADPKDAAVQLALSNSFHRLGDVALRTGKTKEALDSYSQALEICRRLVDAHPGNGQALAASFDTCWKLGFVEKSRHDYDKASGWFARGRTVLLPWHEKKLLAGQYLNAIATIDRELALCRNADRAIARMNFAFEQKPALIAELLDIRTRALLARGRVGDAIRTGERWAEWAETAPNRDEQRYNAACVLALCAAVSRGRQKDLLVSKALAALARARDAGYFKDAERIDHFTKDADFDGIREQPTFAAFAASLMK